MTLTLFLREKRSLKIGMQPERPTSIKWNRLMPKEKMKFTINPADKCWNFCCTRAQKNARGIVVPVLGVPCSLASDNPSCELNVYRSEYYNPLGLVGVSGMTILSRRTFEVHGTSG